MTKQQVGEALREIGTLLELRGENPFRCQAYHNAARALENLQADLAQLIADGQLDTIRGVGETLREKITILVQTGELPQLQELRAATPAGLFPMLRVAGLGPKKVMALHAAGISDIDAL